MSRDKQEAGRESIPDDWRPTASMEMLAKRARMLRFTREFFTDAGYMEVDTPLLSHDIVVDAHLEPMVVEQTSATLPRYLQTSPEFAMKRLLAAGAGPIFQLSKAFRSGESGRLHNPEFTLLEWYRPGDDFRSQIRQTEKFVRDFFAELGEKFNEPPFQQLTYAEAFQEYVGCDVLNASAKNLAAIARQHNISIPADLAATEEAIDDWRNLLLAELVEPHLGQDHPTWLYHYPASQAALAQLSPHDSRVAERFELYVRGTEICNGYGELTNPEELSKRIREQNQIRERNGFAVLPAESRLLDAMKAGLPPSSGVALGFDRLLMLATGRDDIADVIPFPSSRA
ncbi:EF-P lysine aminoacylase EpmA [Calycomorphotria hydatis]|uniref:Elongation factor P--(R)-beta-lysine ligase n=1 Tax=Calycomorphotria hydatis TaxID=2528027 RepID=A0A517TAE5_9PLAN|nr:EF-P lysine aminoacylase EpmA [Calycomorphotria hydatis]QDT65344.1 Elongation factor P--(R)-beta-lysine ligase [Calycomorphotria hydatis]